MELLDEMLDRKVEREKLNAGDGGTAPAATNTTSAVVATAGTPAKPGARLCWLCNRNSSLRFRLQGVIFLCFNCFRISYLSLLLPVIDTPARRTSDAGFLKLIYQIEDERGASTASLGDESLASTYGEIIEPQRASFVMNSSMIRQRREEEEQRRISAAGHKGEVGGAITSAKSMWGCPRCTFLNVALARECEACGFVNPGTVRCPVCKALCPIGATNTPVVKGSSNRCTNGEPHRIWNCRDCRHLNTLDGDRCQFCQQPRYWACSHCTALHHMARGEDGLRYCPTCGNYNTPEDVLDGQAKIEKEEKYAELVTAHRGVNEDGSSGGHRGGGGGAADSGEVVFGVNDSQTLEELARQKEIAGNERRLQTRLNHLKISRNVQKTDGNCLFSALANQLFGQPRLHYLVRSLATAYMSYHAEDYSILFDGEAEWRAYLSAMKEQGTWGDELCLNAAARCFHVNIHVITSDRDRWHIVFQYEQLGQSRIRTNPKAASAVANSETPDRASPKTKALAPHAPPVYEGVSLFLAYLAPVHYDDITPSPVAPMMLGELLSGELNKRIKAKQRVGGSSTSPPPPAEAGRPAPASRLPSALPVKVRTASSESLVKSYLESSTGTNATAPVVPRSRPPSSSNKEGAHPHHSHPQDPPRPPPTPPTSFRGHGEYTY